MEEDWEWIESVSVSVSLQFGIEMESVRTILGGCGCDCGRDRSGPYSTVTSVFLFQLMSSGSNLVLLRLNFSMDQRLQRQ